MKHQLSALAGLQSRLTFDLGRDDGEGHIVDRLIAERAQTLTGSSIWPVARPFVHRILHYHAAVAMADRIAPMTGREAFAHLSDLLSLDVAVTGLDHLPQSGPFILAPNHPTGIADGIAVFDAIRARRPDMVFFANRDAIRVNPRFGDMIIPVEWRAGEKSRAKSRDTLVMAAKAIKAGQAVVLFPSGRIAHWNEGALTERPWQGSVVSLARKFDIPLVPMRITARNSRLFYLLSRIHDELRDMTVFHELLNKHRARFEMTIGPAVDLAGMPDDPALAAAQLRDHVLTEIGTAPVAA